MPEWVNQVGVIVAAVIGLGAIVQFLRRSSDKGTIATLESSNASLLQWQAVANGKMSELETAAAATKKLHEAEVKALNVRVRALEAENERLQAQRPSAEILIDVTKELAELRRHAEQHDADIKALFANVTANAKDST